MSTYSIFLVSQKNLDSIELLDTAFDSREKAEAYANRYKTHQEPDIREIIVNPPYHSDPNRNCYYLEVNMADRSVNECYVSNTLQASKDALDGTYAIDTQNEHPWAYITVIAESEKEAINQSFELLNSIILYMKKSNNWLSCESLLSEK